MHKNKFVNTITQQNELQFAHRQLFKTIDHPSLVIDHPSLTRPPFARYRDIPDIHCRNTVYSFPCRRNLWSRGQVYFWNYTFLFEAHPGHEWRVSWMKRSQSIQNIHSHDLHLYPCGWKNVFYLFSYINIFYFHVFIFLTFTTIQFCDTMTVHFKVHVHHGSSILCLHKLFLFFRWSNGL